MRFRFLLILSLAVAFIATIGAPVFAQETAHGAKHEGAQQTGTQPAEEHEAVPLKPAVLFRIGGFTITNSMLVTWIVALGIILAAQAATRNLKAVPSGAQNFWEWMVESLYGFLEGVIGSELVKKTFWFFATIFIFILFLNWFGLIPGVGTIGWGHHAANGVFHVDRPLLRGANADLNLTLAMACVFFVLWAIWAVQANGPGGVIKHLFGPKGNPTGFMLIPMIVIFFLVGLLEVVSILFRPISLSFRLFGNVYAGENMLEAMSNIVPSLGWLIPIPFYFMELLVGIVQALVFMLLTAVFVLLIAQHEPGHGEAHH
ncbi:MAG: F0F1 ATP synthase subunit A [Verrucomicrobiota bacterium]|nr:F0F1 ATP synthase subunit A [Verrucomicrobiota bacterium]